MSILLCSFQSLKRKFFKQKISHYSGTKSKGIIRQEYKKLGRMRWGTVSQPLNVFDLKLSLSLLGCLGYQLCGGAGAGDVRGAGVLVALQGAQVHSRLGGLVQIGRREKVSCLQN